ncbi:MAG: MMPL family transporter [Proteobacteria bacterium]|nr:MMPL family transporter [Pseudomonadota bacterium]
MRLGPAAATALVARAGRGGVRVADRIDVRVGRGLAAGTRWVLARARFVVAGTLLVTVFLGIYTARNLGVNSDNVELISPELPFRKIRDAYARQFPILSNSLLVVIDAETPELARDAAARLAARLGAETDRFTEVTIPGAGPFFERHALLYRDVDEVEAFALELTRLQPVIGSLEAEPTLSNLAALMRQALPQLSDGQDPARVQPVIDRVRQAAVAVVEEYPVFVSWEEIFLQGSAIETARRRVVLAEPVLEFGALLPAGPALARIRAAVAELGLDSDTGVRVRVTGNPALNHEEMVGLFYDIAGAGVFCFLLVAAILYRALRSLRIAAAAVVTLLVGLVQTAAFATAVVGHLNLISIAFAVLFIGLGVDFAIHLGMHYAERRRDGDEHEPALVGAVSDVGASLLLCAVTTAVGFLVFVPTDYLGVAELGLIAGMGMPIIFGLTLTFFPALLSTALRPDGIDPNLPLTFRRHPGAWVARHARTVLGAALGLGAGALLFAPDLRFDSNVVDMRNPETESVQAFNDLLAARGVNSPWYVSVVAPSLEEADRLARRLETLPGVERTITLSSYVPGDQEEKREILADAAFLLDTGGGPGTPPWPGASVEEQLEALRALRDAARVAAYSEGVLATSLSALGADLDRLLSRIEEGQEPEEALARLEETLLGGFPAQVTRLRRALEPDVVTRETLPPDLTRRMLSGSGAARIQVFPRERLDRGDALEAFVGEVRAVEPTATGMAVDIVEFGRTTADSLVQALVSAVVVITALLLLIWRRVFEAGLVLLPLMLAAALTGASMVALGLPFNFANVIVLPLLLGIGVDSGIHLVQRARDAAPSPNELLGDTTARAVFYSAITTVASFGSLAFSSHRGVASLGVLLVIGIAFTVLGNLIVLPAALTLRNPKS